MIKIVPLIVSLISVFSTGAMPLDDMGKELIEQDNKQIVMVAEKPDSNAADRPFIKEPRHKASTAELKNRLRRNDFRRGRNFRVPQGRAR